MVLIDGKIAKRHVDISYMFKMSLPGICFKKGYVFITFAKIMVYLKNNQKKGQTMIKKNKINKNPSWNRTYDNLI